MSAAVKEKPAEVKPYQAFVAGVFSGIAKLCGKYCTSANPTWVLA